MEEKDLREALAELKVSLENSVEKKAEGQTTQIKSAEEKIEAVEKAQEQLEALVKEQTEKEAEVKAEDFAKIQADLNATIKALDILQIRIKNAAPEQSEEAKSFSESLRSAIEKKTDDLVKLSRKELKSVQIEMKAAGDITTGNVTGSSVWGAVSRPGIITNPPTQLHIRSLTGVLPSGPATDFYFMKENGEGEGNPAFTAEGATKPQFDYDLIESSVKFETLAGWVRLSRKALNNIPGMLAFLQSRMPERLLDVEDTQILYGNGASPNIKGILTAGNFTASTASTSDPLIERIIADLSAFEGTFKRVATGILLRPADFYSLILNKASGSGEYDMPSGVTFSDGQFRILGVPVFKSTALQTAAGPPITEDYIVGDFVNGVDLFQQEAMSIGFFDQDGTNVRDNKITVRIEETVALPVYGDNYFIKGNAS